jgi:uncharacterized membrane protein (DUF2068 family)
MPAISGTGYYGFKVIGTLKLFSGLIAVAAGFGAIRFLEHDPGPKLERTVIHLGLDPQNQIIHTVISRLTGLDRNQLRTIAAGTFFYAILHSIEGIGLLLEKAWAGYLVVLSTSTLVPFEIYEIAQKPTYLRFALFLLNVGIVIYLIITLRKEHLQRISEHNYVKRN